MDLWQAPDGIEIETCAIVTTAANELMTPIHPRMPVLIHQTDLDHLLGRTISDPQELQRLFLPYPAELLQAWQVSKLVNNQSYDSEDCVRPLL